MRHAWIALLAGLWAAGFACAQEMKTPRALPKGVSGMAEFHNLDTVQEHLQSFLAAAAPGTPPFAVTSLGLALLAKTLKPGMMEGVQPARILLVKCAEGTVSTVLQFWAKDVTAYHASLLPTLVKGEDSPDGITSYTQEKREFDRKAFQQASKEERKNVQNFMTLTQTTVAIGNSEHVVCVGDNVPAVRAILALVRDGALGDAPLLEGGDVAAQVEVAALLSDAAQGQAGPLAGLSNALTMLSAMAVEQQGQDPERLLSVRQAQMDAVESVAKQAERLTARLDFDAKEARLSLSLAPVRGSKLSAYFASVQPGVPAVLKYIPEDSFFVAAFKVGDLAPLAESFGAFSAKMGAAAGQSPAGIGERSQGTIEMVRAWGDEFAFGIGSGQGMRTVEAKRLKDAAAYQTARQKRAQFSEDFKTISTQLQTETIAYNGHEITRWKIPFDAKPPEDATPERAAAFAKQQKLMKAVLGDAMTMDAAVLEKDHVEATGRDFIETIKLTIDGKQKAITDSESFRQALAALPPHATGFALVHVTGFMDWAMWQARVAQQAGANAQGMIPELKFQPGPGATAVLLKMPDGSVNCDLRVPAAEIKAVTDGFKAAGAPAR